MTTHIRSTGFTLLELLVVVAVIAMLAGILAPAMSMVRASAKTSSCANNLRQIQLALASYAHDNEGNLPAGYGYSGVNISWDDLLADYDGRSDLPWSGGTLNRNTTYLNTGGTPAKTLSLYAMYTCPADDNAKRGPCIGGGTSANAAFWSRTYSFTGSYNPSGDGSAIVSTTPGIYISGGPATSTDWAANLPTVSKPSQSILLLEVVSIYGILGCRGNTQEYCPENQALNTKYTVLYNQVYGVMPQPLHRNKWNYLFCDGHVELLTGSDTRMGSASSMFPSIMWKR